VHSPWECHKRKGEKRRLTHKHDCKASDLGRIKRIRLWDSGGENTAKRGGGKVHLIRSNWMSCALWRKSQTFNGKKKTFVTEQKVGRVKEPGLNLIQGNMQQRVKHNKSLKSGGGGGVYYYESLV